MQKQHLALEMINVLSEIDSNGASVGNQPHVVTHVNLLYKQFILGKLLKSYVLPLKNSSYLVVSTYDEEEHHAAELL